MSLNELHELKTQLLSQLDPGPNIITLIKQYQFPILVYLKSVYWLELLRWSRHLGLRYLSSFSWSRRLCPGVCICN